MRKYIDIITESLIDEDCVEHEKIRKGTWTEWSARDGIYVVIPGSNTVYVGFCEQPEAEEYAERVGNGARAIRWGRYKELTDEQAEADPEIRNNRIKYGFYVEPRSE